MHKTLLLLLLSHHVTCYGSDAFLRLVVTEQWEKPRFAPSIELGVGQKLLLAFGSVTVICHRCITTYADGQMLGFQVTKIETTYSIICASEDDGCSWETLVSTHSEKKTAENYTPEPTLAWIDRDTCYPQGIDWIPEWLEVEDEEEEVTPMPPSSGAFLVGINKFTIL